jgi:hypothetical protein
MKLLKYPLPWLATALGALLASFAGADLRLLSAAMCGMAVLTASWTVRDASARRP